MIDRLLGGLQEVDGHLLWTRRLNSKGYGEMWVNGGYRKTHRLLWEHENGPVPEGMELGHTCEFRHCARHVRPVTHAQNVAESSRHKEKCKRGHKYNRKDSRGWNKCDECRAQTRKEKA